MASYNWDDITRRYQHDYALTGITIKEWCKKHDINYASARRYIKSDAQLPADSQTFYVATPDEQIPAAKTAKKQRKSDAGTNDVTSAQSAQNHGSAQSAQSAQISAQCADKPQRDERGYFLKGNKVAVGAAGNPHPSQKFQPGHRHSYKHGGYAKFFPAGDFESAREMRIQDEIVLTRAQIINVVRKLQEFEDLYQQTEEAELKLELYKTISQTQSILDSRIARVESLSRTLSGIQVDKVTVPLKKAEEERVKVTTKKTSIETNIMEREQGGSTTPISDIVDEIQSMGSSGLMSGPND